MTSNSIEYDGQRYKVEFIKSQWYTLIFRISIETRRWWHIIGKSCHINIIAITTFSLAIMETKWKDKKTKSLQNKQPTTSHKLHLRVSTVHHTKKYDLEIEKQNDHIKTAMLANSEGSKRTNQVAALSDIQQMTHCISWKAAGRSWSSSMTAQTSCCQTSAWK